MLCGIGLAGSVWGQVQSDGAGTRGGPIRTIGAFWNEGMSPAQIDEVHDLDFEFEVLYYDPIWNVLWVQQGGAGTFFPMREDAPLPLRSNQRVRVTGQIVPRVGLDPDRVKVQVLEEEIFGVEGEPLDTLDNPAAISMTWQGLRGLVDRQREMGVDHVTIDLIVGDRMVVTQVMRSPEEVLPALEGRWVRLDGAFVANAVDGLSLWVPGSEFINPIMAGAEDPFSYPRVPIRNVGSTDGSDWSRVSGVVFSHDPGRELVLRDDSGQLVVKTPQLSPLRVGDWVDVVGFPVPQVHPPELRSAVYRHLSEAEQTERVATSAGTPEEWLTQLQLARQVLRLSPEALAGRPVVWLVGTVLYVSPERDFLYLQDASGGVKVVFDDLIHPSIGPGTLLEVDGVAEGGGFEPRVRMTAADNSGNADLPPARRVSLEQASSGMEAAQWVRMEGYLRATEAGPEGGLRLHLVSTSGEFVAEVQEPGPDLAAGSVVQVTGVCANEVSGGRPGAAAVRLLVSGRSQLEVQAPAAVDPFALPVTTIEALRGYRQSLAVHHPVHTRGVVSHHLPGRGLWMVDGEATLQVLPTAEPERLVPGQTIDVVGIPGRIGGNFVLREARYRVRAGEVSPPRALPLTGAVVEPELEGRLVRESGELVDLARTPQGAILFLRVDGQVVQVRLDRVREDAGRTVDAAAQEWPWETGSLLDVMGLYQVVTDESGRAVAHQLLARSAEDLEVLRGPPWWSEARAEKLAIGVLLAALGATGWLLALQRRVGRQRQVIARQVAEESFQRQRFQDLVDQATEFIFTTDLAGRFTSINTSGERMTGFSRKEALERTLYDLFDEKAARRVRIYIERRLNRERAVTFESHLIRRDGTVLEVEASGGFIHRNGEAIGCYGIMRDISQRKQVEAQRQALEARSRQAQKLEALGTLASGIAHDFNNILASIQGAVDLSRMESEEAERQELFEQIGVSARRAKEMVAQILAFSRHSSSERKVVDLRDVVREVHDMLCASLPQGVVVTLTRPAAMVPVLANATEMHRVLMNVGTNAWHALPERGGEVHLELAEETLTEAALEGVERAMPGRYARLEVRDTGAGMTPEVLERIFDPFFTTKHDGRGTGLGLAAVHGIVRSHGGFLRVTSEPGQGTCFRVYLPISTERPAAAVQENPDDLPRGAGQCVLLVDDDRMVGVILGKALRKLDYVVMHFTDSREALAWFEEGPGRVDAVLSDLSMPGLTGWDLAEHMLRRRPDLPFILQSGHIEDELVLELRKLGVRQVFAKPVPIGPLARVLHDSLVSRSG